MTDDLDPAAVERAAVAAHDAWATHPIGPDGLAGMDLWRHIVRAALTAARAGEPTAPTVSAEQVGHIVSARVAFAHDDASQGMSVEAYHRHVVHEVLADLGIEVRDV